MIFDPELAAAAKRHARAQAKARQKAAEAAATTAAATEAASRGGAVRATTTTAASSEAPAQTPVTSSSATSIPSKSVTDAARSATIASARANSSATSSAPPQAKLGAADRRVDHEGSSAEKAVDDAGTTGKAGSGNSSTRPIPGGADGSGSADSGSGNRGVLVSRTSSIGDSEGAPRTGPIVLRSRVMKPRVLLKIVVLGSSNVGKTSLMKRYVASDFSERRRPTIGADFMTKEIIAGDQPMLLQIWDTAGQERFHGGSLGSGFFRGANAALLVYDVSCAVSFEQVAMWREELLVRLDVDPHDFPIVVIGNKLDLAKGVSMDGVNGVNKDRVRKWCEMQGMGHIETSAKDGTGVDGAMQAVAMLALDQKRKRERDLTFNPSLGGGTILELADERARQQKGGGCCP